MKIRNRLYIGAAISIVLVVVLLSVVLVTSGRIAEENEKHLLLMDVDESIGELDIVTYEYLLHHEERMEQQWNSKYNSLGEILDGLAEEEGLLPIRADYAALGNLFSQVTENYRERQEYIQEGASQEKIDTMTGLEERLVAQLLITSRSVITDASRLSDEAQAEVMEAQRLAANLTLILMLILAITVIASSIFVARSISKPLDELTKGAEIIGKGDLEHKVEVKSKDELGQLGVAFNEMTGSLKEITASRDELDREVTQRKQAEEVLQASEERFRDLVENTSDWIWEVDINGVYTYSSPKVNDLLGYKPEEVIGKTPFDSMNREEAKRVAEEFGAIVESQRPFTGLENANLHKDGRLVILDTSGVPVFDTDGQFRGYRGIDRDITERKRTEKELLKANTELTAVNKELEAFAYSVSHDLRAPLRGIDGFSQALLEDYPDRLDEQGKDYLNRMRSASQRMAQLIDDMLNLSRITRREMVRDTVDLSTLAQAIAENLKQAEPERQVKFAISKGLVVNGDARLLTVLLENLLGNAWKFTSKHSSARIEFGVNHHKDEPVYFVRDNGAGFDMAYVDKLFGAFQRLHAADEFSGTGIGLATVQRIVHRHGGRAWAEGEVEKGATFYFTLQ